MLDVPLPHNGWKLRPYQKPLWKYLTEGGKRALAVWHRRAGKDELALHWAMLAASQRPANYWHCLPLYEQCRKTVWNAVNPHSGRRRIDEAFPLELRSATNESEMLIRFVTGSTWQLVGSDSYDSLVGSSAAGITFSEYALSNPSAWTYLRPMIEENDGWAIFITTPRGRNHAFDMAQYAERTPSWFYERLSVKDTGALTDAQQAETLAELTAIYGEDQGKSMFAQEYLVSFNTSLLGSFYAFEMQAVRDEGRILPIEPIVTRPVNVSWDLGVGDDTALFWFQVVGSQVFILDCYSNSGVGVEHYRDIIMEREAKHGWQHGRDYVPHDANVFEFGAGRTRVETMQSLGLSPMRITRATLDDGINAVRRTLPLCVFHPRCEQGIAALELYRREWDDEKKCFKAKAVHDWTSDYADSFRYLSQAWRLEERVIKLPQSTGWRIPPPDEPRRGGIQL